MAQLRMRGLRPSSLEWAGNNLRYNLLPQVGLPLLRMCCLPL